MIETLQKHLSTNGPTAPPVLPDLFDSQRVYVTGTDDDLVDNIMELLVKLVLDESLFNAGI